MTEKQVSGLFRLNVRVSQKQNKWLEDESAETGLSKSALVQLAVENYIQQRKTVDAMGTMHELFDKMAAIEKAMQEKE